ncbi:MAG: TRAP transporter large permease [Parvularculaceae bacterium]
MDDPILIAVIGVIAMFMLIAAHAPVGAAMGIAGVLTFAALAGFGPGVAALGAEAITAVTSLDFAIIPLFLLMGGFAVAGGLSTDLYKLAHAVLGHRRGGLAMATIGVCALFGAICGSAIATVATMTRVALPEMLAKNYKPSFAAGSIVAGGALGVIIPPSLILVIYAVLTELPVLTLFAAAVVPGIIATLFQLAAAVIHARLHPDEAPPAPRDDWPARRKALTGSWAVVALGVIVTGGIYGGVFTVTEAASVGAAGAFLMYLVRGRLSRESLTDVARDTARNAGVIYVIVIGAFAMTYFLAVSGLSAAIVGGIQSLNLPPIAVILAFYVMYLALGAVFESLAVLVVTLPFVMPVVIGLGYDPVWWGVMLVMISGVGMITPPIGINVFVLHGMMEDISLGEIFRGVAPFFIADIARVLVLTFIPGLVTWLPKLMGLM